MGTIKFNKKIYSSGKKNLSNIDDMFTTLKYHNYGTAKSDYDGYRVRIWHNLV